MKTMMALAVLGIGCWVVMFIAGSDVWHFSGSPDFWHLSQPPYHDVRIFAYAFYTQFVVLLAAMALGVWNAMKAGRQSNAHK